MKNEPHFLEGKVVKLWFTAEYSLPFDIGKVLEIKDGLIRFQPLIAMGHIAKEQLADVSNQWFHFNKIHSFVEIPQRTMLENVIGYDAPYCV